MAKSRWSQADRNALQDVYRAYWRASNAILRIPFWGPHHWKAAEAEETMERARKALRRYAARARRLQEPLPSPADLGFHNAEQLRQRLLEDEECELRDEWL